MMGEISRRLHRKLTKLVPPGDITRPPMGWRPQTPGAGHPQDDRQGIRSRSCRLHLRAPHHVGFLGKRLPTPRDANLCPRGRQCRGGIHALGSTDEPAHDEFLLLLGVLGPQDRKDNRHAGGLPHRSQRLDLHEPGSVGGSQKNEPIPHGDLRAQRDGGQSRPPAGTDHRQGVRLAQRLGLPRQKGELWFVRLLPPLVPELATYDIVFTTLYVLIGQSKKDWIAYLKRSMVGMDEGTL